LARRFLITCVGCCQAAKNDERVDAMINAQMVEVEALRDRRTYELVEGEI